MMKIECSTSVKMIFSDILVFKMKKKDESLLSIYLGKLFQFGTLNVALS